MDNLEYLVSLDNITIVGVPVMTAQETRSLLINMGFINQFWQTPYKRYNDNYTLIGGGMLQLTHETGFVDGDGYTVHQIRLEFNPNKISMYKQLQKEYLRLLKLIKEPKITRKDIAVDLRNIDINDFSVIDFSGRKRVEYKKSTMELETLYFGSKHSDERHRIYNKAVEQGIDKELGIKWWRVEAQLRKEKAEMRNYNAFSRIKVVYKNDYGLHDIRTRAMLYYLQANPDGFKELSVNARTKYKRLLSQTVESYYIDLEGMMEESKKELQAEIESWLNFSPRETEKNFKTVSLASVLKLNPDENEEGLKFSDRQREKMKEGLEGWWEDQEIIKVQEGEGKEGFEKWQESVLGEQI